MGSSIDNTFPAASVQVSKATFRTQLGYAKTELDHGGFFRQTGAAAGFTGQLERQSEQRLNDLPISVRDYGAVGDGTSRPVSQWLTGGARARGYANLAALQVDYPHVASTSDEVDWAAIQKALTVASQVASKESRRVVIPAGIYKLSGTLQLDRNVVMAGQGVNVTWLQWTSALTSGPCVLLKPTPSTATANFCTVRDFAIDANNVPTTNLTNHGLELYNQCFANISDIEIWQPKGCGMVVGQSYFCSTRRIYIVRQLDSGIRLQSPIIGSDAYGNGDYVSNGNYFHDITFEQNYRFTGLTNVPATRPRVIDIIPPCGGNFFDNVQVQTGTYRLDDCLIFMGGTGNKLENFFAYDGPGTTRTFTTSSGAGGVIRIDFGGYLANLVSGNKITATGVTGITNGTLYTVNSVSNSEFIFDVAGTTYSGSPQTGRMVRGASITATAAGGENRIQCTCANHGLFTGQQVTVAGITGGTGAQGVVRVDRDTFQLAGTTYGGSSQAGTWTIDRPTSLVQFGDMGSLDGYTGTKNWLRDISLVMNHDDSTLIYALLFTGLADANVIEGFWADQNGELRPYLVENGATGNTVRDWPAGAAAPVVTSRLVDFQTSAHELRRQISEGGYGWDSGAKLALGSRLIGKYQWAYLVGSNIAHGEPVYLRSTSYGLRVDVNNQNWIGSGSMFWGAAFTPDYGTANASAMQEIVTSGYIDIPSLDPTGHTPGDPVFLSSTGYTWTAPTANGDACILVGRLVDSTGTTSRVFIQQNFMQLQAYYARLGMRRFTADPTYASMGPNEVAVGTVAGVGKIYWKDVATAKVQVFVATATIT